MGFVAFGGFVVTIDGGNYVATKRAISEDTFREVAEILGIPQVDIDRLMAHHPRTIYIYRGRGSETAPFNAAGMGGGGDGGGGGHGGGGGGSGSNSA